MKPKEMPTQQEIKKQLHYDEATGIFTWIVSKNSFMKIGDLAGGINTYGYWIVSIDNKHYMSHRLAWVYINGSCPSHLQVDHINGDKSDNRINNLRLCNAIENQQNIKTCRVITKSRLLGAHKHSRSNKWSAQIKVNKKYIYIGLFDTPEEAHQAYLNKKRELHPFNTL